MLIVTDVDASRRATGYYGYGPPTSTTINQNPAGALAFAGQIDGDKLRFETATAIWAVKFTFGDNLHMTQKLKNDTRTPTAMLEPVWRLVERERSAGR